MSSISPTSSGTTSTRTTTSGTGTGTTPTTNNPGGAVITASGLGSGVNIDSIVQALVAAESAGQTSLITSEREQLQSQISAYSQFTAAAATVQTAVDTLTSDATFNSYAGTVGDTTVASASVSSSGAVPGQYSLLVTQLAQGTTLTSGAFTSAAAAVGTGTLTISAGSSSFNVAVPATGESLQSIVAAINGASGNPGVSAALVTGNDGVHLVLSSTVTGAANGVTISQSGGDGGLAALTYAAGSKTNGLTQTQAAQDAIVAVNGYTYNSASNAVTGALSGVTINLLAPSKNATATTLTVASDPSGPTSAINTFVQAYNSLVGVISQLDSYDSTTDTPSALFGNSLLENFRNEISSAVSGGIPNTFGSSTALTSLAQIGISVNLDGTLAVDSSALKTALTNNPTGVTKLFTGVTSGVASKVSNLLSEYTSGGGLVDQTVADLNSSLAGLQTQQNDLNAQVATLQSTLYAEYNNMDLVVSQLKQTGTAIAAQLAALPTNYLPTSSSSGG